MNNQTTGNTNVRNDFIKKQWFVIAQSKKVVNQPLSVKLFDVAIVLYRKGNEVIAMRDVCPHRGVPLSQGKVRDNCIECPYHGLKFNSSGQLVDVPGQIEPLKSTKASLHCYPCYEKDGFVWINLNEQEPKLMSMDTKTDTDNSNFSFMTFEQQVSGKVEDVIENFLDPMHTHYVHSGIIRSGKLASRKLCQVKIVNVNFGYQATYIEEGHQTGIISRLFGADIENSIGRITSPSTIELEYNTKRHTKLKVVIYVTPDSDNICKLYIRVYLRNDWLPFWLKMLILAPFQWVALRQDRLMLAMQNKNLKTEATFNRKILDTDIMRCHIENTLQGKFVEVNDERNIHI